MIKSELPALNEQYNWNTFNPITYSKQYRGRVLRLDGGLGHAFITLSELFGIEKRSLEKGLDACNGGIINGAALQAEYVKDGGVIEWMDLGKPQVRYAAGVIRRGRRGDLGDFAPQQTSLGRHNRDWSGAGYRACELGKAVEGNVFKLEPDAYDIGTTLCGPESLTGDHEEWRKGTRRFFGAIRPGGLACMIAMYGSSGWNSAGPEYPAVPICEADILEATADMLEGVQTYSIQAGKDLHEVRPEGEPTTFTAIGLVMGIRK